MFLRSRSILYWPAIICTLDVGEIDSVVGSCVVVGKTTLLKAVEVNKETSNSFQEVLLWYIVEGMAYE